MYKLHNKSQVTLFIIIGLLIVIIAGISAYFYTASSAKKLGGDTASSGYLDQKKIEKTVGDCLEVATLEAIELFGLSDRNNNLTSYINDNIPDCLKDFKNYRDQGFAVEIGLPVSDITINSSLVLVELNLPVSISKGDANFQKDSFQYQLDTISTMSSPYGVLKARKTLYSRDENLIIFIDEDTLVTDKNNEPVESISLRMSDRSEEFEGNNLIISSLVYDGLPEGLNFNPPLKIKLRVQKSKIGGASLDALKISWFSNTTGIMRTYAALPYEEDEDYYYFSARVDHFTPIMLADCGSDFNNEHFEGFGFKQLIDPYYPEFFQHKNDAFILNPELMGVAECEYHPEFRYNLETEYPEISRESICSPESGIIYRDWDNDDSEEKNNYQSYTYSFFDNETRKLYTIKDLEITKLKCYESCIEQSNNYFRQYFMGEDHGLDAKMLPEKFRFDPAPLISGDGIVDGTELACELEGDGKGLVFVASCIDCIIPQSNEMNDGLELDLQKLDEYPISGFMHKKGISMEDIKELNYTMQPALGGRFFATIKTMGYSRAYGERGSPGFVDGSGSLEFEIPAGSCIIAGETPESFVNDGDGNPIGGFSEADPFFDDPGPCSKSDDCRWRLNDDGLLRQGKNIVSVEVTNNPSGIPTSAFASGSFFYRGKLNSYS